MALPRQFEKRSVFAVFKGGWKLQDWDTPCRKSINHNIHWFIGILRIADQNSHVIGYNPLKVKIKQPQVGGWTYPSETYYCSHIGSFPPIFTVNIQKIFETSGDGYLTMQNCTSIIMYRTCDISIFRQSFTLVAILMFARFQGPSQEWICFLCFFLRCLTSGKYEQYNVS